MDRNLHPKYTPKCPRNIPVVDQYSWDHKDTNDYMCENGISHPIYDCNGWVQFSLPLELYPPRNDIHPQIKMVKRMHLNWRNPEDRLQALREEEERIRIKERFEADSRLEGMYQHPYIHFTTNRVPGYPLPDPNPRRQSCGGLY
jgi:hypothetical protein